MLSTISRNSQEREDQIILFKYAVLLSHRGLSLNGSRTIASKENCPSTPKLTLTQPLTLTGDNFPQGHLSGCPPTLKVTPNLDPNPTPNREAIFLEGKLSRYHSNISRKKVPCKKFVHKDTFLLAKGNMFEIYCYFLGLFSI